MHLALITDEVAPTLEEVIPFMLEHGVEAAELRTLWGTNIAELDLDRCRHAARLLRRAGLKVCAIASPVYKTDLLGEGKTPAGPLHGATQIPLGGQPELLRRCLERANLFEAPLLRIFSFWKRGALTPEVEAWIAEALEHARTLAERAGVTLILENEHHCYLGTGMQTRRVLERLPRSPYLRACWDPGNAFCAGEEPETGYEALKPWIAHVHIKDAVRSHPGGDPQTCRWVPLGEGQVNYPPVIARLQQDGYQGYLSLEPHARVAGCSPAEVAARCLNTLRTWLESD